MVAKFFREMLERKDDILGLFELLASHRETKQLSWREFESGCRIIGENKKM